MRRSQNFDFLDLTNLSSVQFWGALTHPDIIQFYNFLLELKNHTYVLFYYFNFERSYERLCILLNKNFNKNGTESKMENPTHSFRGRMTIAYVIRYMSYVVAHIRIVY